MAFSVWPRSNESRSPYASRPGLSATSASNVDHTVSATWRTSPSTSDRSGSRRCHGKGIFDASWKVARSRSRSPRSSRTTTYIDATVFARRARSTSRGRTVERVTCGRSAWIHRQRYRSGWPIRRSYSSTSASISGGRSIPTIRSSSDSTSFPSSIPCCMSIIRRRSRRDSSLVRAGIAGRSSLAEPRPARRSRLRDGPPPGRSVPRGSHSWAARRRRSSASSPRYRAVRWRQSYSRTPWSTSIGTWTGGVRRRCVCGAPRRSGPAGPSLVRRPCRRGRRTPRRRRKVHGGKRPRTAAARQKAGRTARRIRRPSRWRPAGRKRQFHHVLDRSRSTYSSQRRNSAGIS